MPNMIRLKPTREKEMYVVLSGNPSVKDVNGEKKEVKPLSTARFIGQDILENPPADSVMFMYDNGFAVDGKIFVPAAMSPNVADVEMYRKGDLLVFSTYSDMLIDSYRVLQIVGALPSINGNDVSDVRAAEDFVRDYYRLLQQPGPWGRWNRIKAGLGFPNLPQSARKYTGKIDGKDLVAILHSIPTDTRGTRLEAGGKTNLVVASPALQEEELAYLLEHPEELDELRNLVLQTDYGIIKGVRLLDTPAIISTSQGVGEGQSLEELLSSAEFYNTALRNSQLRSLIRSSKYADATGLVLSPVRVSSRRPKMVFGPEKEVSYLQGVQAVASSGNGGVVIDGQPYVKGLAFKYHGGINLDERVEKADGIAHIAVFEQTTDLRRDFASPRDLGNFDGNVNVGGKVRDVFERYFREAVNNEGKRIEQEKGVKVSGVVLSPIKVQTHTVDALIHIATDPQGEYRLAATYLVGK